MRLYLRLSSLKNFGMSTSILDTVEPESSRFKGERLSSVVPGAIRLAQRAKHRIKAGGVTLRSPAARLKLRLVC